MSRDVRKRTIGHVRPVNYSDLNHLLGAFWMVKDTKFLHADNKYSDQIAFMQAFLSLRCGLHCYKVVATLWNCCNNVAFECYMHTDLWSPWYILTALRINIWGNYST